jgi:hypothetical protein
MAEKKIPTAKTSAILYIATIDPTVTIAKTASTTVKTGAVATAEATQAKQKSYNTC